MFSVSNRPGSCCECDNDKSLEGWFTCQECHRVFCSNHCIKHRHFQTIEPLATSERYNRYDHLDQIAEWERKAIDKIRKQADEARRPLIAPPTPAISDKPSISFINQLKSTTVTKLLSLSSTPEKQSLTIDPYELLSDETLNDLIGDQVSGTSPPEEQSMPGRVSFASQYPYMSGLHHVRLSIDRFNPPLSWAFVGIVSNELRLMNSECSTYSNRSSFGWHLGRRSIINDRTTSTRHDFDGRDTRQGDIINIKIDCDKSWIQLTNERTFYSHTISIDTHCCPLPWYFAVNINYGRKDFVRILTRPDSIV